MPGPGKSGKAGSAGGGASGAGKPYRMTYQQWIGAKDAIMARPSGRTAAGWNAKVEEMTRLNYGAEKRSKSASGWGMEQQYRFVIAKARGEGKLTRAQAKRLIASSRAGTAAG